MKPLKKRKKKYSILKESIISIIHLNSLYFRYGLKSGGQHDKEADSKKSLGPGVLA